MKIIGCGNPDRGDDQAGLLVAQRLRELGYDADTHTGDPLLLLDILLSTDDVILVDAMMTGARLGTVRVWNGETMAIPTGAAVSSHAFDIGKVVELAKTLRGLPAGLRVYGIEGRQFAAGDTISSEVENAITLTVQQIAEEARAIVRE